MTRVNICNNRKMKTCKEDSYGNDKTFYACEVKLFHYGSNNFLLSVCWQAGMNFGYVTFNVI